MLHLSDALSVLLTSFGDLNLDSFVQLFRVALNMVLVLLNTGSEQGIDKSSLSYT